MNMDFDFCNPTHLLFGSGKLQELSKQKMPGGKEKFWGQIPIEICSKEFKLKVRKCVEGDIQEIDTFKELKEIDPIYAM